jgi:hypothetical protein
MSSLIQHGSKEDWWVDTSSRHVTSRHVTPLHVFNHPKPANFEQRLYNLRTLD